jgi:cellulose synthase/poly-beta-1,6-N-acetylglucosamine synthase-like glycosyltransferase
MLDSLTKQTVLPTQAVVVNDHSTDNTQTVINRFTAENHWLKTIEIESSSSHIPGSKVINAFYKGLDTLDDQYDIICKFDADIILPENYIEQLISIFKSDDSIGIAGGLAFIKKSDTWVYETVASKNHVRGPFKAYRKACFKAIGGLKHSIGWDTIDVLLAQYQGWKIKTDASLKVKHLKPTGQSYNKSSRFLQGEAFYKMRYGLTITVISALKKGLKNRSFTLFLNDLKGFINAKRSHRDFIVSEEEGKFIRNFRWKAIFSKLGL